MNLNKFFHFKIFGIFLLLFVFGAVFLHANIIKNLNTSEKENKQIFLKVEHIKKQRQNEVKEEKNTTKKVETKDKKITKKKKKIHKKIQKTKAKEKSKNIEKKEEKIIEETIKRSNEKIEKKVEENSISEEKQQQNAIKSQQNFDAENKDIKNAKLNHYQKLIKKILNENKKYPKKAILLRKNGDVLIKATINDAGKILQFEILKPAKFMAFNDEVKRLFKKIKSFPPPPKILLDNKQFAFSMNVVFALNEN